MSASVRRIEEPPRLTSAIRKVRTWRGVVPVPDGLPRGSRSSLVKEEAKIQRSIYYISRVLRDIKIRYTKLEKLTYALLIAARSLRPYFQGHTIILLTDQPIKAVLHRADASGSIAK